MTRMSDQNDECDLSTEHKQNAREKNLFMENSFLYQY
jgi:hypothetical protein